MLKFLRSADFEYYSASKYMYDAFFSALYCKLKQWSSYIHLYLLNLSTPVFNYLLMEGYVYLWWRKEAAAGPS